MIKCVIADDEALARKRVRKLLEPHGRTVEVIKEFESGKDIVSFIKENCIDLLFLDIEMPFLKGTEIIKQIPQTTAVIFTTAYREFALEAFEDDAVDYLLKPISQMRFDKAVFKATNRSGSNPEVSKGNTEIDKIPVKLGDKHKLIPIDDIAYFQSSGKYTDLITRNNNTYIISESIASLSEKLKDFSRIHRGIIVNPRLVTEIKTYFNSKYIIVLSDSQKTSLTSGRSYASNVKKLIDW